MTYEQWWEYLAGSEPPCVEAPTDGLNPDDFYVFQGEEELAAVLAELEALENADA